MFLGSAPVECCFRSKHPELCPELCRRVAHGINMDQTKLELSRNKYKLPIHWIQDPLSREGLVYFGYVQIVLDQLPALPANVLDAGCGDGRIAEEIIRRGYTVVGVDILDISISYARTMVPEGDFFVADLRGDLVSSCGLRAEQFDAIVMVEVYEHLPPEDCPRVLANLRKVLRPGGTLIISVPSKLFPLSQLHYRHLDRDEFERELTMAGFQIGNMMYQLRMGSVTDLLLSDTVERLLNNRWLQPIFLKRLRRHFYMKYINVANDESRCGRFIAIARR